MTNATTAHLAALTDITAVTFTITTVTIDADTTRTEEADISGFDRGILETLVKAGLVEAKWVRLESCRLDDMDPWGPLFRMFTVTYRVTR